MTAPRKKSRLKVTGTAGVALLALVAVAAPAAAVTNIHGSHHKTARAVESGKSDSLAVANPFEGVGELVEIINGVIEHGDAEKMQEQLDAMQTQMNQMQASIDALSKQLHDEFLALQAQQARDMYQLEAAHADDYTTKIDAQMRLIKKMYDTAHKKDIIDNDRAQLQVDLDQFNQNMASLKGQGEGLQKIILGNAKTGQDGIWVTGFKATVATEKANMHSTLYTPEMSAQTAAVVNAWTGYMTQLQILDANYYGGVAAGGKVPTPESKAKAAQMLEADGINDLVAEVKAKAPKPIPKKTVLDLSTGLLWGNFTPAGGMPALDGYEHNGPVTKTKDGGEADLETLLYTVNGREGPDSGWPGVPVGGPEGSDYKATNWQMPQMYEWSTTIDGKHETSLTEHHDAQVGAPAFPEKGGLLTQFDGQKGADLLNSMHRVAPDVFTTAANGGYSPTATMWVNTDNEGYQPADTNGLSTVRDVMGVGHDDVSGHPAIPASYAPPAGEAQINLFSKINISTYVYTPTAS